MAWVWRARLRADYRLSGQLKLNGYADGAENIAVARNLSEALAIACMDRGSFLNLCMGDKRFAERTASEDRRRLDVRHESADIQRTHPSSSNLDDIGHRTLPIWPHMPAPVAIYHIYQSICHHTSTI